MLVAVPTARLMFQHGAITALDAGLIARSTTIYAGAIWAFSLLQIVNRAYYAVHDTVTPLVMSVVNVVINLVIEIPLLWVMGESGMAVGTVVSFAVQAAVMLYMLDRKIGGLHLRKTVKPVAKMLIATAAMTAACLALRKLPFYPTRPGPAVVGDPAAVDARHRCRRLSARLPDHGRDDDERIDAPAGEEKASDAGRSPGQNVWNSRR